MAGDEPWMVVEGRRLSVGRWLRAHPGGEVIRHLVGQDATVAMHMFHDVRAPHVARALERLAVDPPGSHPVSDFDRDYLALEAELDARGWFTPSPWWVAMRVASVLAWLVAAWWAPGPWLTGLCFGLFVQQSAFLGHDACHGALVPPRWRRWACWWFVGACFGISHREWTREHDTHHAIVSRPPDDPQMNYLPLLLFSGPEAEHFERTRRPLTDLEKLLIATQHVWVLPVLLLLGRVNLHRIAVREAIAQRDGHDLSAYAVHWLLWASLGARVGVDGGGGTGVLAFVVTALAVTGILHVQLLLSHAYAPRLFAPEHAALGARAQVVCNQNVRTTWLDGWLHGGLEHHIEHHLFPRLPRHRLRAIRGRVRALAAAHGLPYREDPIGVVVADFLRSLAREGAPYRRELRARLGPPRRGAA